MRPVRASELERAARRITRTAAGTDDLVTFWDSCREALERAVPHYLTPCWYTLDPASLLITTHYDHGLIPQLAASPPSTRRPQATRLGALGGASSWLRTAGTRR
jgi:hypothetical protein